MRLSWLCLPVQVVQVSSVAINDKCIVEDLGKVLAFFCIIIDELHLAGLLHI